MTTTEFANLAVVEGICCGLRAAPETTVSDNGAEKDEIDSTPLVMLGMTVSDNGADVVEMS